MAAKRTRANTKAVSNEEIIAALLQHGSVTDAAAAAGISPRTIYERLHSDNDFRGQYAEAKNGVLRRAVVSINDRLSEAITAVADIMNDTNVNAAVRLQAAQTIINNAGKLTEQLQKDEKYARSESADPFDMAAMLNV